MLQVAKDLRERGIALEWNPKTKFKPGGLKLMISAGTSLIPSEPLEAEPN